MALVRFVFVLILGLSLPLLVRSAKAAPPSRDVPAFGLQQSSVRTLRDLVSDPLKAHFLDAAATKTTACNTEPSNQPYSMRDVDGIMTVLVCDLSRVGQNVTVLVNGERDYGGTFDRSGQFECRFAVPAGDERVEVDLDNQRPLEGTATGADLSDMLLFVLRWRQPIDLGLRVLEPGQIAPIERSHPIGQGGGRLKLAGQGCGSGWREEVFVLRGRSSHPRATYRFRLDFISRGDVPRGAYCWGGQFAAPDFEVVEVDLGHVVNQFTMKIKPEECGIQLNREQRYPEIVP